MSAHAQLADQLRRFGAEECLHEPLYAALSALAAETPQALELLNEAPPLQRIPNLLLAALHERVLAGAAPALAAYYPTAGGNRAPDAGLAPALLECLAHEQPTLQRHLRQRATQTNEVARCAALWPALADVVAATGRSRLALLDFGCSAGLNLGVDRVHLRYRDADGHCHPRGTPASGTTPEIDSLWLGKSPPPEAPTWDIAQRDGLDPAPVNLQDPDALRWLLACLWPSEPQRLERLRRASASLQALPHRLRQADDCISALEAWCDGLNPDLQPVMFTSWVLYYLSEADLARLRATVDRLCLRHGLAWVTGELPHLSAQQHGPEQLPVLPALPADQSPASATLWALHWRVAGQVQEALLGWSHPHGRWVHWQDAPVGNSGVA